MSVKIWHGSASCAFMRLTGSFAGDAVRCFIGTGIEALAIGNCYLRKEEQPAALAVDYKDAFKPD